MKRQVSVISKEKFDNVMKFYDVHNQAVFANMKKDYSSGLLVPFVGAGLSAFCGYRLWPNVLKELVKFIPNKKDQTHANGIIAKGKLLNAAQYIKDNYPPMLKRLSDIIKYSYIRDCDADKLRASAVYLLPFLFPNGLVMTTNFDRVLEEVYDKRRKKFEKVVTPYESELLTQMLQNNPHCLFKLHGDIGEDTISTDKLVFTEEQYDQAYAPNGELVQVLTQWFKNKKLLFLGCSLSMDKTMEILKQVTSANSGLGHYAILSCKPNEKAKRLKELDEMGVSAIFYKDGNHNSVRIILERLLEETNQDAFKVMANELKPKVIPIDPDRRFMYDTEFVAFTGRDNEMEMLDQFCNDTADRSWWAVTGPGGIGKSRLVHEFVKKQKKQGWSVHWLRNTEYDRLSDLKLSIDPCIVVADDFQAYQQKLGSWLTTALENPRSEKLRLLLLERDGKDVKSASWIDGLQATASHSELLTSRCYNQEFLQLEPLSEDQLKTIMTDYAMKAGKPLTGPDHTDLLLETLKRVDNKLTRPIYAQAIADAWCSGKDPTNWNKSQVLDALVDRELRFFFDRLQAVRKEKPSNSMMTELRHLLARSCRVGILPLAEIKENEYPMLCKFASDNYMDLQELLHKIGVSRQGKLHKVEVDIDRQEIGEPQVEQMEAVVLDCPDLIKEHLVLRTAFDGGKLDLLLPKNWENDPISLIFIGRIFIDYPEKLEGKKQFWDAFLSAKPESEPLTWLYSNLLVGSAIQVSNMAAPAVKRLAALYSENSEEQQIAVEYAYGLAVLSEEQPLTDCEQSVSTLKSLYDKFGDNEEIAVYYARSLRNLFNKQQKFYCKETSYILKEVQNKFSNNEHIALIYAYTLAKLADNDVLDEYSNVLEILKALSEKFDTSAVISADYTYVLLKNYENQECVDIEETVHCMQELHKRFETDEDIAYYYSVGLSHIISRERLFELYEKTIHSLATLHKQFETSENIAHCYAAGLSNLITIDQPLELREEYIHSLATLHKQFETSENIAHCYAYVLSELTTVQSLGKCKENVKIIEKIREKHSSNEDIEVSYIGALVNLSLKQTTEKDVRQTLKISQQLINKYSKNAEILLRHAMIWFNLTLKQSGDTLDYTVSEIRTYLLAHPDIIPDFQEALDKYLSEHPDYTDRYAPLRV